MSANRATALAHNLLAVQTRIADAVARAGRNASSVRLVAVSKKMPAEDVVAAMAAGQVDFGENYAQELRDKHGEVELLAQAQGLATRAQWHFIGPLQSNKAKFVAGQAALIHTIDSQALATEVNRRVPEGQTQACLVQVNVAGEPQKRGITRAELPKLLDHFALCPRLTCQGFMLIPPLSDDPEASRPHFQALRTLLDELAQHPRANVHLRELSMGMSHDLEVAIEEGATFVRVGTAIFGPRPVA